MPETTQFTIGAEASCSDGPCGAVIKVVVNPVAQTVTHLVVEPKHRAGLGRLVPLDLVEAAGDQVQLRCTTAEFEALPIAEEIQLLPGSGYAGYSTGEAMSWPYYSSGNIGPGNTTPAITHDTLPLGEVAVQRGQPVHATDGEIGHVEGLVIQPHNHHVSHVLLQEGHIWGRKVVAIPISAVSGIDDGIRLTLTKDEIEALPPVDVDGFWADPAERRMTGPVTECDVPAATQEPTDPEAGEIELSDSHVADVAGVSVRRALPRRSRRTIGAWCFLDHMGPFDVSDERAVNIGPHPHTGLQTVTWLISGELLHRDSLGSEQLIRPGQLNLMTAGAGVSHAEESTGSFRGELQGVQLWVAQPEATRHGAAAFEHHGDLPQVALDRGEATVLVGALGNVASPARHDTELVGIDLELQTGSSRLPLAPAFEHGLVVLDGALEIDQVVVEPGHLAYLGLGREHLAITAAGPTRAIVIGGLPFPEPLLMWWNFVARTRDEVSAAYRQWQNGDDRFGVVASPLARIPASPPAWLTSPTP